jgi:hypothetical protein
MESEKAELEAELKVNEGSRPEDPAKKPGSWWFIAHSDEMVTGLFSAG